MARRAFAAVLALLPMSATAQECLTTATRAATFFERVTLAQGARASLPVAGTGWHLTFEPAHYGWRMRLYDGPDSANYRDLSAVTPPHAASLPNVRDLFGWHFRNAANTGPNTGEVNAPQHLRRFFFTTALAGAGAHKPAPVAPTHLSPDPDDGRGWLRIDDMTLSPTAPGARAVMREARLDICLTWPRGATAEPEDRAIMGACGLDLGRWRLVTGPTPRLLAGDFDGDGVPDNAALVRATLGGTALAICRAGTWLDLLEADRFASGLLPSVEAWRSLPRDHGPLGYVNEPAWPAAEGEVIVLERIEKSLHLVYRARDGWRVQEVYRLVTEE